MHRTTRLAIIADDLSSATDCGIQVAQGGLRTVVPLQGYRLPSACEDVDVISVDTDSRSMAAQQAYHEARRATSELMEAGCGSMYKSVDSTLRGNLGAEIDGVLDALGIGCAVIAPAYPLYGRTTIGARHLVNGTPIDQTEFGSDPRSPVRESNIVKLLSSQSKRRIGHIALDVLHAGNEATADALVKHHANGAGHVVFDVREEEDLERLALAVGKIDMNVLWVGSTGLARVIPAAIGMESVSSSAAGSELRGRQIMIVAGSASEITRKQLLVLENAQGVTLATMNPLACVSGGADLEAEIERCSNVLVRGVEAESDVVLRVSSTRKEIESTQEVGRKRELSESQVSNLIVSSLAGVARQVLNACELRGVILTGGDTAKAVCESLEAEAIRMISAVEPGIPLGVLMGAHDLLVVTKAGGFGSENALIASVKKMRNA